MAIYNLPVLFCSVFLLYFLTFFLDFKFFLNDRLTIKTVATNQDFFRFGQGIVTQIGFIVFTYLVVCQELIDG